MIKAIAFDPGKTTGFATGEIPEVEGDIIDGSLLNVMLVQTAQAEMTHGDIMNFITSFAPNYIICERFDFRQKARTGLELISREFIGVINLYCEMNPNCTLVMQSAGQVINGHFTNEKLKQAHLYRKGCIHANEATMHLCYWYRFGSGSQYGKEFHLKSEAKST